MAELPDDIWLTILEIGVARRRLTWKELCSLSMSCRRFDALSNDEYLWAVVLFKEFGTLSRDSPAKDAFRIKFERYKALNHALYRGVVESRLACRSREMKHTNNQLVEESKKLEMALEELKKLKGTRQALVPLKVWQPEIVGTKQKQIVEQNPVPLDSRIHVLEMEINLCRQQISRFSRNLERLKKKVNATKEYLASLEYDPTQSNHSVSDVGDGKVKPKKMKLDKEYSNGQGVGEVLRSLQSESKN